MKKYTLNDYYRYTDTDEGKVVTRIEVYADNDTAAKLLMRHKRNEAIEISVSSCVDTTIAELPMPDAIMALLDNKIKSANKRVAITGIDAYLVLLDESNVKRFIVALKSRIDEGKLNAVYMIGEQNFYGAEFSNPKYADSFSVVYLVRDGRVIEQPAITVIAEKWLVQSSNPSNWNALLGRLGQFAPTDEHTLVLCDYENKQAGLSNNVTQLLNVTEIAARYYHITEPLPKSVLEILILKCKEKHITQPLEVLKELFGANNTATEFALSRLLELQNDELWTAYVWYLKNTLDGGSYLSRVLEAEVDANNLLRQYVSATAIRLCSDFRVARYANERAMAIRELGTLADSMIIEFIGAAKDKTNDEVAPWLNCGKDEEREEIVRRVSKSDLTVGLPKIWSLLYPELAYYLSDEYDYGSVELTDYFRDYRRHKVTDTVTQEFTDRAYAAVLPLSFPTRDSILQDLSSDLTTALLVVDGMGAEYYPLLLAMAKCKQMNVQCSTVASVHLPSSTEYNNIKWEASRCVDGIHGIDNISHVGAENHDTCTFAQNIVATLHKFEAVFKRIAEALNVYERIVVTADHGSSRLAVLAHEQKMSKTLPWVGMPQDWRFAIAPTSIERPAEFESSYDAERNLTYWVVRGYNRLPKQGGKLSVHGGATYEERIVPVVVFSKAITAEPQDSGYKPVVKQLVEKAGFDEI